MPVALPSVIDAQLLAEAPEVLGTVAVIASKSARGHSMDEGQVVQGVPGGV